MRLAALEAEYIEGERRAVSARAAQAPLDAGAFMQVRSPAT